MIKAAIIGTGNICPSHIKGYLTFPERCRIVALCDIYPEKAQARIDEFSLDARAYADYKEMLEKEKPDLVSICLPPYVHAQIAVDAMEAGANVVCEKPMALTREDTRAMIRAADESGRQLMVGQICRFTPAFEKAKALIDDGTLGDLYFVESEYAHDYMKLVDNWRSDPLRHGVIGGGCHAVDLLRWLAGEPREVFAYGTHRLLPQVPYDDATVAVMKFDDKTMGKVFVSTGCKRDYTMRTVIYGTKGTLICDNTSPAMTLFTVDEDGVTREPETIEVEVNNHNAAREFEAFADAILHGKPVLTDVREGARTVAACLAIIESSRTGKPVRPDYSF